MASYKLITTEDEKYISEFMDWLQENITPSQVDQETFANNIMNISNIMKFGSGGVRWQSNFTSHYYLEKCYTLSLVVNGGNMHRTE